MCKSDDDDMQMVGTWLLERASMNAFEILLPTDKREGKWSLFAQEAKFCTYANIMQNYVYFDNRFKDKCQWIRTILIFVIFTYLARGLGLNKSYWFQLDFSTW